MGGESPSFLFVSTDVASRFNTSVLASMGNTDHMSTSFTSIVSDYADEVAALNQILQSMSASAWETTTPAPGWNVADQVIHLGLFDRRAMWSITQPDVFVADRTAMATNGGVDAIHAAERRRSSTDLLSWWQQGSRELIESLSEIDMSQRCAWYGPSMSATSMMTARLMETWAHAHDISDALGHSVVPSMRLRHVAHIGVRAMPFAFAANKRDVPPGSVYVHLTAPDGSAWTWGEPSSDSSVHGDALGFCQAVTQRRHVDDCGLSIIGEPASTWMSIAQAFAGPPGVGRVRGQFS